jgi:hypothetical protein
MHLGLKIANRLLPLPTLKAYQKAHYRLNRRQLSRQRGDLAKIIDPNTPLTIVFPPSLDWSKQLFQRPQQMAAALAKQGVQVLYFQHREHWEAEAFQEIRARLVLCSAPLEVFWELPTDGLFTYAMTWNCRSALAPNIEGIIYDYVDDLSVFPGSPKRLASDHVAFTRQSRLVLATSETLLAQVRTARPDAQLCSNGVDYEHFAQARNVHLAPPEDLEALLADGKPLAGYMGALARWFDYPLLEAVAKARLDWRFILIGPDHDQTLPENLLALPNVHWLGAKPYQELPAYLRCFSAALIPFQLNPVTHATSPLKLYEYMAAGNPVISTSIHEATHIPGVLLAKDADEFAGQLDQARVLSVDATYLAQSDEIARQNTWEKRTRQIIDALSHP